MVKIEKKRGIMKKMTKLYVYILEAALLLGFGQAFAAWDGASKSQPAKEDGYYIVKTEAELAWFAGNCKNDGDIRLMADMDMGGHHFVPLCAGDGGSLFSKVFDGNGFSIRNLYIDSDTLSSINAKYAQNLGLVAALSGTIKNVNFVNAKIYASQDEGKIIQKGEGVNPISVGVAVGWMAGGTVSGVSVVSSEIRTSGTGQSVGGVVGYVEKNKGPATISNCYSNAEIIAYGNRVYAGGVAGYAQGDDITISGVVFDGTVDNEGNGKSGGILGKIYNGKVVSIKDFGAFVNILSGVDGMLHISQISDKKIAKVSDVLKVGQEVRVRLVAIDDKGRLSLSMRNLD